ncbi:MAG: DUF3466 family protein [Thermodesulfobacteriota bacterium]|nr:DUF3466 family protein [Thermodesulfobacteriota bacterium]
METMRSCSPKFLCVFLLVACLVLLAPELASASVQYNVINLEAPYSEFGGINNSGQIALSWGSSAYLWENGTTTDLGTLGGSRTYATGINNSGLIVGVSDLIVPDPHYERAFLWENGVMGNLGTLGGDHSVANDINDSGQVVGRSEYNGDSNYRAFLWEDGSMADLIPSLHQSEAMAINNSGQIAGYYRNEGSDQSTIGFLWEDGNMTNLEMPFSSNYVMPSDINDEGEIVGRARHSPGRMRAFSWDSGVMTVLDVLPGTDSTWANGSNDSSQIVGGSRVNSSWPDYRALLWEDGTVIDLNELIADDFDWILGEALDINDNGEILCFGYSTEPNVPRQSFLLTPVPIPSTALLFIPGLGLLGWLKKRRGGHDLIT